MLELRHTNRQRVSREAFVRVAERDAAIDLADSERRTLKQWLAARYGRPAFPNAFESRLRKSVGRRSTVEKRLAEIVTPDERHIVGVFFDLGEHRGQDLEPGTPYALSIAVVYDAEQGAGAARAAAESIAANLSRLFFEAYGTPEQATELALEACEPIADTHMSLADLRRVDQWRLEYASLRTGGAFMPAGELPG